MKAKTEQEVEPYKIYEKTGVFKWWFSYPLDTKTGRKEYTIRIAEFDFFIAEQENGNWVWLIEHRHKSKFLSSYQVERFISTPERALESFMTIGLPKYFATESKVEALKMYIEAENKAKWAFPRKRCLEILEGKELPILTPTQLIEKRKKQYNGVKYRGVYVANLGCSFVASVTINYERHYLGSFDNPIDAAKAVDKCLVFNRGYGNCVLNFPDDWLHLEESLEKKKKNSKKA